MSSAPQYLFDELRAYKRSRALAVALSMGLVEAVGDGQTAHDVGVTCGISTDWALSLLDVLADLEVVARSGDTWKLTSKGEAVVADEALLAFAGYHFHCYEAWQDLPERCRGDVTGDGFHRRAARDTDFARSYLLSMDAIARRSLPLLARRYQSFIQERCHPNGTVLDVGAGPSTFGRHLVATGTCRVAALDIGPIVEMAQEMFGCPTGLEWVDADFREYVPPQKFDALLCSHVLEYASELELPQWLKQMGSFLRPGGMGVFVTFLRDAESVDAEWLNLFELSTGVNGERLGHLCSADELRQALRDAGASKISCERLPSGPSYSEYSVGCIWE